MRACPSCAMHQHRAVPGRLHATMCRPVDAAAGGFAGVPQHCLHRYAPGEQVPPASLGMAGSGGGCCESAGGW